MDPTPVMVNANVPSFLLRFCIEFSFSHKMSDVCHSGQGPGISYGMDIFPMYQLVISIIPTAHIDRTRQNLVFIGRCTLSITRVQHFAYLLRLQQ